MASLFAQYKMEREGKSVLENEHGFLVFSINDNVCMIEDMFILKSHRNQKQGQLLFYKVMDMAVNNGCNILMCAVSPLANGSQQSLEVILHMGFKLFSSKENMIYLAKELK